MRPILITGATGTLGRAFARICAARGLGCRLTTRDELDIARACSVDAAFQRWQPWAVINTAGYVRVDDAEDDSDRCQRENVDGARVLASACERDGVALLTFSSDLVFDGAKTAPYAEDDAPAPLSVYGRTKAEAEQRVLDAHGGALIIRTSAFFGPWDGHNFVTSTLRELAAGGRVRAASDAVVSPTYVPDLVHAALDLVIDGERGIWHLCNAGATSWADLGRAVARLSSFDERRVDGVPGDRLGWRARRPRYSVLATGRGALLAPLDDALRRYLAERDTPATTGGRA